MQVLTNQQYNNKTKEKFKIILSSQESLSAHCHLINKAYDREDSWTDRKLIIKIDYRIDEEELKKLYDKESNLFFILQSKEDNNFAACVNIEYMINNPDFITFANIPFYTINLFCTDPKIQSQGLGKYIFFLAEKVIKISALLHLYNITQEKNHLEEIESMKIWLTENYELPENFYQQIQDYSKKIILSNITNRKIENIFIKMILAKTGLFNFYTKYGYIFTDVKISLHEYLNKDQVLVESHFGILNKKIDAIN